VRFDYGSILPWVRAIDSGVTFVSGPYALRLTTPVRVRGHDLHHTAEFEVAAGDRVPFVLTGHPSHLPWPTVVEATAALNRTTAFWRDWSARCTYHGDLRSQILQKYTDQAHRTFAASSTIQFNYNAAINLLNGDAAGGALEELRASINYSNEDSRIITVMQNLTPAQLAQIPDSELDKIAADLDGEMLERFNALRRGDGGMERAITLRNSINDANTRYGTERGRKLQEAVATARNAGGVPIEGDPNRAMADIFHLEHPDAVRARGDALWRSTLENFADLRQVQYTLHYQNADADPTGMTPELSEEQRRERYREPFRHDPHLAEGRSTEELEDMMLRFAVADRYYGGAAGGPSVPRTPPPGYHGETSGIADRPGRLPPDMVNWISQTIHHGPGSVEERGAHALLRRNREEGGGTAGRRV
jgi:hypothetical protein